MTEAKDSASGGINALCSGKELSLDYSAGCLQRSKPRLGAVRSALSAGIQSSQPQKGAPASLHPEGNIMPSAVDERLGLSSETTDVLCFI